MANNLSTARENLHSRYERRLADAAVAGRRVEIQLRVRRLFCEVADCPVKTFVEQVEGLTERHGRRTTLLRRMVESIGWHCPGVPGCGSVTTVSRPNAGAPPARRPIGGRSMHPLGQDDVWRIQACVPSSCCPAVPCFPHREVRPWVCSGWGSVTAGHTGAGAWLISWPSTPSGSIAS
jgi:hypothetical protein